MTFASATVAIGASIVALISAWYWQQASRVGYVLPSAGPGDEISALHWQSAGIFKALYSHRNEMRGRRSGAPTPPGYMGFPGCSLPHPLYGSGFGKYNIALKS